MSAGTTGRSSRWRGDRKDEESAACQLSPSLPRVAYSSMVQQVPFRSSFSKLHHGSAEKIGSSGHRFIGPSEHSLTFSIPRWRDLLSVRGGFRGGPSGSLLPVDFVLDFLFDFRRQIRSQDLCYETLHPPLDLPPPIRIRSSQQN